MTGYLARRALQALAAVLLVTMIVYGLARAGSAAAAGPSALAGYLSWLGRVATGNLGFSAARNQSVGALLAASLPRTLVLAGLATAIALAASLPLGLAQAIRRNTAADHLVSGLSFLFYGTPSFFLGTVLIVVFADRLHMFGAEGPQAPGIGGVLGDWRDLTLPVATLTAALVALFTRYLRAAALDSLAQDYVRAALAKGAGHRQLMVGHVLRNSLIPLVTLVGLSVPRILGATLVTESVFSIQGAGWQFWQAAQSRDVPVLLGFSLVLGVGAVIGSLLADVAYAALDPRIRYAPA